MNDSSVIETNDKVVLSNDIIDEIVDRTVETAMYVFDEKLKILHEASQPDEDDEYDESDPNEDIALMLFDADNRLLAFLERPVLEDEEPDWVWDYWDKVLAKKLIRFYGEEGACKKINNKVLEKIIKAAQYNSGGCENEDQIFHAYFDPDDERYHFVYHLILQKYNEKASFLNSIMSDMFSALKRLEDAGAKNPYIVNYVEFNKDNKYFVIVNFSI